MAQDREALYIKGLTGGPSDCQPLASPSVLYYTEKDETGALQPLIAACGIKSAIGVAIYYQCGGIGYTGNTVCDAGLECKYQNDWYWQVGPISAIVYLYGHAKPAVFSACLERAVPRRPLPTQRQRRRPRRPTTTKTTTTTAGGTPVATGSFTNPIKTTNGSEPFMVYDGGYYYLLTTTWGNIQITRAPTIAGLKTAPP
ncbi:hypothetical protein FS837_011578 [Tulasnella sp. UAMH 9824]|nr:hypothetical protein FS837_011578 [Tulasnella sp. UAMH 9824]